MLRIAGLVSALTTAVFASCVVFAQEPSAARRTPRIQIPKTVEETVPVQREPKATDRLREFARARIKTPSHDPSAALADLGASGPFDYSVHDNYLVAAMRDGGGLALWDPATRRRLHRLENSDRRYSLVAISDEGRWIAGVRHDSSGQIDLWRADNGRHVRVIRAAGGPKSKIEFTADNELRVVAAAGDELRFSVPSGAAIGAFGSSQGGSATKKHSLRIDSPKRAMPSAPSTARAAPPVQSPPRIERKLPTLAPPPTQGAGPAEPRIPASAAPRMAPPRPTATSRQPREESPPPPAVEAPAETSDEPAFEPAAPAGDEPASAAPDEPGSATPEESAPMEPDDAAPVEPAVPAAAVPFEPSGGAGPELPTEAPAESGAAPPEGPTTQFHFEMGEEPAGATPEEPEAASAATAAPEKPPAASVSVHFATNRNRLTPKDRAWSVYFAGFFGSLPAFVIYGLVILAMLILPWFGKRSWAAAAVVAGSIALCAMGLLEAYVRSQLRDEMTGELYGCRPTDISYGSCEISVPPPRNRRPGEVSRPVSVWIFEAPENPEKHFMLRQVESHADKDVFYRSLSALLAKSDARAALLFIHGYNVSFEDAIFRTAQLAVDLKFPGAPVAFCWPSYADPVKYTFDEQHAEVSIPALREVLDDLAARSGATRIHIIAHSMGNRVLAGALRGMDPAAQARNQKVFRELVLAAPDIDSRVFKSQVLPHIVSNTQHCTLYASSRDRALLMSRCFHNYQRLGETDPELLVAGELDTIDASLVDTSLLGHSYIGDVQSIVSDLHDLVVGGKRPTERLGLQSIQRNALEYWSIKPELRTATDPLPRR